MRQVREKGVLRSKIAPPMVRVDKEPKRMGFPVICSCDARREEPLEHTGC